MDLSFLDGQSNEGIKKYINYIEEKNENYTEIINELAFYLAEKGNLELIKYLIEDKKVDINNNIKNEKGKRFLFNACVSLNIELVNYLIELGAEKKEALKISVEQDYYRLFKNILNKDKNLFEELKKEENNEWKQILKNRLNKWLEWNCKEKNISDIKLLLFCGANYEIFYKKIESLIDDNWIKYDFYCFIENFENDTDIIKKISQYIKKRKNLQEILQNWLKDEYKYKFISSEKRIKFLKSCIEVEINNKNVFKNVNVTEQKNLFKEKVNFTCGYTRYANKGGNSRIIAYEIGKNFVRVYFSGSYKYNTYTYTYKSASEEDIEEMKRLAVEGQGLLSYIMNNVKFKYEKDSRKWTQIR